MHSFHALCTTMVHITLEKIAVSYRLSSSKYMQPIGMLNKRWEHRSIYERTKMWKMIKIRNGPEQCIKLNGLLAIRTL